MSHFQKRLTTEWINNQTCLKEKPKKSKDSIKIFWKLDSWFLGENYFTDITITIRKWKLSTRKICHNDSQVCMLIQAFSVELPLETFELLTKTHELAPETPEVKKTINCNLIALNKGSLLFAFVINMTKQGELRNGNKIARAGATLIYVIQVDDLFGSL